MPEDYDLDLKSIQEARRLLISCREAQRQFAFASQETVDRICKAMAEAAFGAAARLGQLASEETGYGVAAHKRVKNEFASRNVWESIKDIKTVGVIGRDERRKVVAFSKVYYLMQNRFVARKGVALTPDLAGKVIAVQTGTPQDRFVTQQYKQATVKRYVNAQDPMLELTAGRADFTFGNTVQLQKGFLDTPNGKAFGFIGPLFDGRKDKVLGEGVAVALRKQDSALKARFDQAIDQVKQSGEYAALLKKHNLAGLLED